MSTAPKTSCAHCGQPSAGAQFCCSGCEHVYTFMREAGLERYYELRGAVGQPVQRYARHDRAWIEPIAGRVASADAPSRVDVDIQGLQCSACVWVTERIFERQPGAVTIVVNPTLGRASMVVRPSFSLDRFAAAIEELGYVLGPPTRTERSHARTLLARLGICAAAAMNAMIFSVAIYAGLADATPALRELFETIDFALATLVVVVGGSVFFGSAWEGLRKRVLHLDLPIALGIAASYAGSVWVWRRDGAPYFDTVCVFVTLMLVGRFLQERLLERNRRLLLEGDDASALLTRRIRGSSRTELVAVSSIEKGDRLLIAPGDLFPVDVRAPEPCACSLDWINGESRPRTFASGAIVPAGAFSCSSHAVAVVAEQAFADSTLLELLRTPLKGDARRASPFWSAITRRYVAGVLVLACVAFAIWMLVTHDASRALAVTTAVLVVTCPCAFGIATPLAYDLAHARLRQAGLFVRMADFLDRAPSVRRVVFDKTGTLTSGVLRLVDPGVIDRLDPLAQRVLATLVSTSGHPKAVAIAAALDAHALDNNDALAGVTVTEHVGDGLACKVDGSLWKLGKGDVFSRDGRTLARFDIREEMRPDAAGEIAALEELGCEVWIASGDSKSRVAEMALRCGVPSNRALSSMSPWDKARWLEAHDRHDTLMVGDGVNDLVAAEKAFCSGTPAIDRPFVAARSDFYFVTPGLHPIRMALELARELRTVVRRNLRIALAYNIVAVTLAFAGLMSPLLCAVLMPVSSLSTIAAAAFSLRSRRWT